MDWWQAVDIYCERTGPGFWAEPFNAVSNLAFPAAALWAGIEARRRHPAKPIVWILICMAALIGLGSFLFHTYATVWAGFADTLPIWSFVAVFVGTAMHRIGGVKPGRIGVIALAAVALVVVLTLGAGDGSDGVVAAPDPLNGSGQYTPAMLALLAFTALTFWRRHPARHWILAATLTFAVSLTLRTVDLAVCLNFPTGTHFAWHMLNGVMIGLLLQMLVRTPANRTVPS